MSMGNTNAAPGNLVQVPCRWAPLLLPLLLIFCSSSLLAQDDPTVKVLKIEFVRTQKLLTVSDRQILSRMEIKEGGEYTLESFRMIFDADLKRLRTIGVDFVGMEPKNPRGEFTLRVWVSENFTVGKISFEGLDEFDEEEDILPEVKNLIGVGKAPSEELIAYACARLEAFYRKNGFPFPEVTYEVDREARGRIHLILRIFEGPRAKVDKILFRGNHSIGASKLCDQMETEESGPLFFSSEYFDEEKFRSDLRAVEQYYRQEGWRNAKVYFEDVEYTDDYESMVLVIKVEEGDRYKVGKVSFRGNETISREEIAKVVRLKSGEFYRWVVFAGDADDNEEGDGLRIRNLYGNLGYHEARIVPEESFNDRKKTVDVTYRITEGIKIRLGQVLFRGNHKTRDDVLRRFIVLTPGEVPRLADVLYSFQNLANTKWFSNIQPDWVDTEDPTVKNLVFDIEETSMGDIKFVLGYNTSSSVTGKVQLSFNNFDLGDLPKSLSDLLAGNAFVGGGQNLRMGFTIGMEQQSVYQIDFSEPSFFGTNTSFGFSAYRKTKGYSNYLMRNIGSSIEFGHAFGRHVYASAGYSLSYVKLRDISPYAMPDVFDAKGPSWISAISLGLKLQNIRSDVGQPYDGFRLDFRYQYAGGFLLGDVDYSKASVKFAMYKTLFGEISKKRHIISLKINVHWAEGHHGSHKLPIYERYFAGGLGTIRGFEYQGIGPRWGNDAMGGNFLANAALEYSIPIYRAPMVGMKNVEVDVLRIVFFYDAATLAHTVEDFATSLIRSSVGVGFRLRIPALGGIPISLDFGFPLARQPQDETQRVSFSLGFFFF